MHNGLLFCNITVKYINYNVLRVFSLISRRFVYFSRSEAESILGHDNIAVCRWNAACCRQPRVMKLACRSLSPYQVHDRCRRLLVVKLKARLCAAEMFVSVFVARQHSNAYARY